MKISLLVVLSTRGTISMEFNGVQLHFVCFTDVGTSWNDGCQRGTDPKPTEHPWGQFKHIPTWSANYIIVFCVSSSSRPSQPRLNINSNISRYTLLYFQYTIICPTQVWAVDTEMRVQAQVQMCTPPEALLGEINLSIKAYL